MLEKTVEAYLVERVRALGGTAYKFTSPARASVPDRTVILPPGRIFFIEVKRPGGKLTRGQEREHEHLHRLGVDVRVLDSIGAINAFLNEVQTAAAPAAPVAELTEADPADRPKPTLTLTGAQLLEALDFIAPDRAADQLESEVSFQHGKGHDGEGMYCWATEYPNEGAMKIDGSTVAAQAVAADGAALDEDRIDWIANAHCPGGTAYPVNVKNAIREALRYARAAVSPATADERAAFDVLREYLRQLNGAFSATLDSGYAPGSDAAKKARSQFYKTMSNFEALIDTLARASQAAAPADAREPLPYQKTFDAIAAATSISAGGYVSISVEAFCKAFGAVPADAVEAVLTAAARDVLAERARQVSVEGWTPEHDDQYTKGELAQAASLYAVSDLKRGDPPLMWPWHANWWKPSTPRRNRVKATALMLAEIERLDRAEAREQGAQGGKGGDRG